MEKRKEGKSSNTVATLYHSVSFSVKGESLSTDVRSKEAAEVKNRKVTPSSSPLCVHLCLSCLCLCVPKEHNF